MSCTKKDCIGCRNNFYNGNNPYGVQECWSLKSAKMVTRYQLHVDTPMNRRSGYAKRRVPDCYHVERFVMLEEIPAYAKTDKQLAAERAREAELCKS